MLNQENPIDKKVHKVLNVTKTSSVVHQIGKGVFILLMLIGIYLVIFGFVLAVDSFSGYYDGDDFGDAVGVFIGGIALFFVSLFLFKKIKANLKKLNK